MHPLRDNPFFVLELPPTATPMEIERQGKKLLSMLDLELQKSLTFQTPYGPQPRTPERIREAVQLLLDPARRLPFEPWAAALFPRNGDETTTPEPLPLAGGATTTTTTTVDATGLVWWQP
ncbi:MAG: hypothetical protein Q8O67_29705 [Deltaproteobacteria bacterium]|nr:hypothetical protein [Deltaproteobacteria bacterium]